VLQHIDKNKIQKGARVSAVAAAPTPAAAKPAGAKKPAAKKAAGASAGSPKKDDNNPF